MRNAEDRAIFKTLIAAILMIGHSRKVDDAYVIADEFMLRLKADLEAAKAQDEAED